MTNPLILASASSIRAELLTRAGVEVRIDPARIDEAAIKQGMLSEGAPARDIADTLADLKARKVAGRHPTGMVLGADQVLVHDGKLYDKPADLDDAKQQLRALRNSTHKLLSAVVIYQAGRPVWRHIGEVRLEMRNFSDAFLESYLQDQGDDVLATVGGYKLEEHGAQLFNRITGDYFSVLGLPLLEVLHFLRQHGVLKT